MHANVVVGGSGGGRRNCNSVSSQCNRKHGTASNPGGPGHMFVKIGGWNVVSPRWRCGLCFKETRSLRSKVAARPCAGQAQRLRDVLEPSLGHQIWCAEVERCQGAHLLFVCLKCGAWASSRPDRLLKPCTGARSQWDKKVLLCIRGGKHPRYRDAKVSALVPISIQKLRLIELENDAD